ncbi:MAG: N-acetylmuramoyl-L-alanine amidase [Chthoniobacterales bacterium]|nr:N-acetylmuramoyl-L-alanine amidase [Chthoniobacterales bacterium]
MISEFRPARRRGLSLGLYFTLVAALSFFSLTKEAQAITGPHTVVLDAGHGGFDRGGIPGQRVAEKPMTLDVAQRVARKLRAGGYHVVMTRDSDVFVPLSVRVAIANGLRDAEFVSIHFNSATRAGANGIETYYYRSDSARLAANIHRQVVGGTGTENRGIRRRGFYVLRRTSIPSVLVECGFLTNPYESSLALQSSYRERLADRITSGIIGQSPPYNRPVVAGLTHVASPIGGGYNDFVSPAPERPSFSHHARSSGRSGRHHSTSSSKKKKSGKSKKKKKSDDN